STGVHRRNRDRLGHYPTSGWLSTRNPHLVDSWDHPGRDRSDLGVARHDRTRHRRTTTLLVAKGLARLTRSSAVRIDSIPRTTTASLGQRQHSSDNDSIPRTTTAFLGQRQHSSDNDSDTASITVD